MHPSPPESSPAMNLKQVIEALLFASQKPLSAKEIFAVLKTTLEVLPDDETASALAKSKPDALQSAMLELQQDYTDSQRSFHLVESAAGWQVVSRPDFSEWVRQLYPENRPARLSGPALETLAIIAYRQPVTRADIEAVRGVSVDGVMQTLMDRGLVKIAGRADVPGRPLLYETSSQFLEHFGLKELDELPNAAELRQIQLPTAESQEEEKKAQQLELDGTVKTGLGTAGNDAKSSPGDPHDSSEGLGFEDISGQLENKMDAADVTTTTANESESTRAATTPATDGQSDSNEPVDDWQTTGLNPDELG